MIKSLKELLNEKTLDEMFENRPTKDKWEKCLLDLILEKNKILSSEGEHDKKMIEEIDKAIESIQQYLLLATR